MSAQEFTGRTCRQAASHALLLADLALEHGFCDQSAFSRRVFGHTGETAVKFRQLSFSHPQFPQPPN